MKDYININRAAYNSLADEYNKRYLKYIRQQKQVLKKFIILLKRNFNVPIKILDVGCGVGINCKILEKEKIKCTGIDNAPKMIKYARKNSPQSRFILSNFLNYKRKSKFQGIVLSSFLHLFPKNDLEKVFVKIKQVLDDNGFAFIALKLYSRNKEGLFLKESYNLKVKRFAKFWKKEDFIKKIEQHFNIIYAGKGYGDKKWHIFIVQKIEKLIEK